MKAVVVTVAALLAGGVPPVVRGIDTLPRAEAVDHVAVAELVAVVADRAARPLWRARAARLLGARDVDDGAIDRRLEAVLADDAAPGALRVQVTLALGERAVRRGHITTADALVDDALANPDPAIARAGVMMVWWLGGDGGRRRLETLAVRMDVVGGAARGRLRAWSAAGAWRRLGGDRLSGGVLDPRDGGPPPAR